MKWRNVVLLSFSSSSAKQKRRGCANSSRKPRASSNVMRPGTLFRFTIKNHRDMVTFHRKCFSLSSRRKAEEERIRKEEEKARRELIKQEYLRRKQQALMEEQGVVKPRPRIKSHKSRPKSLHREQSSSLSKGSATRKNILRTYIV